MNRNRKRKEVENVCGRILSAKNFYIIHILLPPKEAKQNDKKTPTFPTYTFLVAIKLV